MMHMFYDFLLWFPVGRKSGVEEGFFGPNSQTIHPQLDPPGENCLSNLPFTANQREKEIKKCVLQPTTTCCSFVFSKLVLLCTVHTPTTFCIPYLSPPLAKIIDQSPH
jgi:hypothetical protein